LRTRKKGRFGGMMAHRSVNIGATMDFDSSCVL